MKITLNRPIDISNSRIYSKDGVNYISVTSLIELLFPFNRAGFEAWCKLNNIEPESVSELSSSIGNDLHQTVELLFNNEFEITKIGSEYYDVGLDILLNIDIDDVEKICYNDMFLYAGRFDAIGSYKGRDAIFDFKTWGGWRGKRNVNKQKLEKVSIQLNMYRLAVDESLNMFVVIIDKNEFDVVEIEKDDLDWIFNSSEYKEIIDIIPQNN